MAARNLALQFSRLALGTRASCSQILPIRSISSSLPKFDSIRDNHRAGTRLTGPEQEIFEGTTGANQLLSVNLKNIEARFPTSETLNQLFDGIPYKDLPIVYIKATKNNTLINVMDNKQHVIIYTSCRLEGFKHARKKTTIAGQTTGVAAGQKLVRRGIRTVRVEVKGIGPGRLSSVKGMATAGVKIVSITDHTNLIELGPRPRKIRRI